MGAAEGEWVFDKFDDDSIKIVKEVQLRRFGKFLDDHSKQLLDIQDALGDTCTDSWDANLDPVELQYLPCEKVALFDLVCTDNKLLNKVMVVLSSLCAEMDELVHEAETKLFNALLCYGECDAENEGGLEDGHTQIQIGRIVPLLQEMSFFVTRSYEVVGHVVRQLSSLHSANRSSKKVINVTELHFQAVFEHLGKLLTALITLDCIVDHHASLTEHWTLYKRMLKSVRHNPQKFGIPENKIRPFEKLLMTLEGQLLDGCIFQNCIQQTFDQVDMNIHVRKNSVLSDDFLQVIRAVLQPLESRLGEAGETTERRTLVDVVALFILHNQIFQTVDKKLFKQLWDTHRKVPCVILLGSIVFYPTDYLRSKISQVSSVLDKKAVTSVQQSRATWLQLNTQSLLTKEQSYRTEVSAWMVKMETRCGYSGKLMQELNLRIQLLTQGLLYACSISNFVTTFLSMHVSLNRPMTKTSVVVVCRLVELLKSIQHSFERRSVMVAETFNHSIQFLCLQALNIVVGVKKQFSADRKRENERDREKNCDIQAALVLAENSLNGPGTKERRLIARLALTVASSARLFKEEDLTGLNQTLHRLDMMSDFQVRLREACDCSFIYWHRIMLPTYLTDLYESPSEAARLQYMLCALRDCIPVLRCTRHTSDSRLVVQGFKNEVIRQLKENLLDVICKNIETDLRLHIHVHLQLDSRNPFKVAGLGQLAAFIRMKPLRFAESDISIKAYVEHYLNKTFYNLTTVALHDWRTYSEMRTLAQQKYGLNMMEAHLPSQTLEQGLDVLEIMRNIHVFVSKFLYNLNNQIFVERSSNNKHLNTINIRHIANSIRTHGTGIMNTTVNFTYQFLTKKFFVFSQFLYDDHIKSRLIKDGRFFREAHLQTDQKYPYERAEKFNRGIRKLGLTPDGLSYLDQFRLLISQIGNAMGYIRMIRSGGLHCCSNAIRFVPDLDDIVSFEKLCEEEGLSPECQRSAKQLDEVITNLTRNFAEGTEYFKMLVDVFAPEFRNPKNMHLRNFYLILPPLTLNFVEHMISSKEKLNKKNKVAAAFTDDGFAMGIAYILKLLDQYQEFDSLHWFQSVRDKYTSNKKQVQAQSLSGKVDEKLQQTMTLTVKRLDVNQQEFDLLYYSLSSARIFFRADKTAAEEREENKTKQGDEVTEEGGATAAGGATNELPATSAIAPPLPPTF